MITRQEGSLLLLFWYLKIWQEECNNICVATSFTKNLLNWSRKPSLRKYYLNIYPEFLRQHSSFFYFYYFSLFSSLMYCFSTLQISISLYNFWFIGDLDTSKPFENLLLQSLGGSQQQLKVQDEGRCFHSICSKDWGAFITFLSGNFGC